MNKKGQAALEFLTTYGWAFLVILTMIGALAYFGVLNPKKFVPDTCTFGAAFICDDHVINTNSVIVKLKNNVESINITGITLTNTETGTEYNADDFTVLTTSSGCRTGTASMVCSAGSVMQLSFTTASTDGTPSFTAGEKLKFTVDIDYFQTKSGSTFGKSTGGDLVGTVQ